MIAARGILALSLSTLLLTAGVGEAKPPKVRSGLYGDSSGEVQLVVHNQTPTTVSLEFHMLCYSMYGVYHGTSGPRPQTRRIMSIRRGANVYITGEHKGPTESGAIQTTFWWLNGKFTSPTRFKGVLGFEMGGAPDPYLLGPACLGGKRLTLNLADSLVILDGLTEPTMNLARSAPDGVATWGTQPGLTGLGDRPLPVSPAGTRSEAPALLGQRA